MRLGADGRFLGIASKRMRTIERLAWCGLAMLIVALVIWAAWSKSCRLESTSPDGSIVVSMGEIGLVNFLLPAHESRRSMKVVISRRRAGIPRGDFRRVNLAGLPDAGDRPERLIWD